MTIRQLFAGRNQTIIRCAPDTTVSEAARLLAGNRIGAMPVLDGDTVAGIFSERDLLYCIADEGEAALRREVASVMTAPAITIDFEATVLNAMALMTRRRIRHLPVIENDRLAAFVSIGDLVKYRIEEIESEAEAMRDYIRTA